MLPKYTFFLLFCFLIGSCSTRLNYYRDFSFLKCDDIRVDSTFLGEYTRTTVMHSDSAWTWIGYMSTTFDLSYKLDSESDSLFIFYKNDTLLLNNMLGSDTMYLPWFNISNFQPNVYKLTNQNSGERQLYISCGQDGLGNRPGRRINFIFPLTNDDRIKGGFAYVTSTFTIENDPCLDCFTDFDHDGRTDYVQWICADNAPVLSFNILETGERIYHNSGYKSVNMYDGMAWGIVRKNQKRYPK